MNRCLPLLLTAILSAAACHTPERADAFIADDAGWSKRGATGTILLYIPNRIVDLLDIVHVGVGIGPGIGLGLHFTRYGRLWAAAGVDLGIGWVGRYAKPYEMAIYYFAAAGPVEAKPRTEKNHYMHIPKWDIGAYLHGSLADAYAGVAPDEILDFLVGWSTYDTKGDDW